MGADNRAANKSYTERGMGGVSDDEKFRQVHLNNDAENAHLRKTHHYAGNRVATSKYTLLRFASPLYQAAALGVCC
jgi:hypothetical protein